MAHPHPHLHLQMLLVAVALVAATALADTNAGSSSSSKDAAADCDGGYCVVGRDDPSIPHVTSTGFEWTVEASSNEELVDKLHARHIIQTPLVASVMRLVDRGDFCKRSAYVDTPQPIGFGATISAPHQHAHTLELLRLHLRIGAKALDIGVGSGYLAACMAIMTGASGRVYGVDHMPKLVQLATDNINKHHAALLSSGRITLMHGDALVGVPIQEQFDVIHIGAAVDKVPDYLMKLLATGGRLVAPVGPQGEAQVLTVYDKQEDGTVHAKKLFGVRFIPLSSRKEQLLHDDL
eukprot:m.76258 g.76258  ORF g.76258 m.76258 type:complete len:293 (+) comp14627_c0_seq1:195-1073(+)